MIAYVSIQPHFIPQNIKRYVGGCILNCFMLSCSHALVGCQFEEERRTYWLFSDFLIQYFCDDLLHHYQFVWFKNLRCLKGLYILALWWLSGLVLSQPSYESCWPWTLRDEWYIVMKAYLLVYNFDILVLLLYCVSVLSLWYESYMQCHRLVG